MAARRQSRTRRKTANRTSTTKRKPSKKKKASKPNKPAVRRRVARRAKRKVRRVARRVARKTAQPKKTAHKKAPARRAKRPATQIPTARLFRGDVGTRATRGLGAEAGGQSGDIEGLTRSEIADSESVEELVEEGQAFEAGIVDAVENAPDADQGEIRTREVPEDDVPEEYLDEED